MCNAKLELGAVKELREVCRRRMDGFGTTAEEDEVILREDEEEEELELELALRWRLGQKRILRKALCLCDAYQSWLEKEEGSVREI